MIELTQEQHAAIEGSQEPVRAVDPTTRAEYVLVRADLYDRLKTALSEDEGWVRNAYPEAMELFAREGWDDPRMSVYDRLDPRVKP
jgi:hypothetical protein